MCAWSLYYVGKSFSIDNQTYLIAAMKTPDKINYQQLLLRLL